MNENLKSHFLNLYSMVMADGEMSPKEKTELFRIGIEEFNVSSEELNSLVFSDEILFYIPQTNEERIIFLYDLALIAWANGEVDDEEKHLLKVYAKKFGIIESEIDELIGFLLEKAKEHLSHEQLLKEFSE